MIPLINCMYLEGSLPLQANMTAMGAILIKDPLL